MLIDTIPPIIFWVVFCWTFLPPVTFVLIDFSHFRLLLWAHSKIFCHSFFGDVRARLDISFLWHQVCYFDHPFLFVYFHLLYSGTSYFKFNFLQEAALSCSSHFVHQILTVLNHLFLLELKMRSEWILFQTQKMLNFNKLLEVNIFTFSSKLLHLLLSCQV